MPRKYTRSGGAHARDRAVGARDPAGGCGTAPPIVSDAPGEPPPVARAHTRPLTRRVDDRRARPRVRNGTPRTPRGVRRTRFVPARARSSSAPGGAARTGAARVRNRTRSRVLPRPPPPASQTSTLYAKDSDGSVVAVLAAALGGLELTVEPAPANAAAVRRGSRAIAARSSVARRKRGF